MSHDDFSVNADSDAGGEKTPALPNPSVSSIEKAAAEIQKRISLHVPVEEGVDWGDVEISLPPCADPMQRSGQLAVIEGLSISSEQPAQGTEEADDSNSHSGSRQKIDVSNSKRGIDEYNEDSIQFFREELDPRFDWRLAEDWARKYRRDPVFVLRGIMACRECCVSPKWFLSRYLERDKDAPRREDVEEAHRRLLAEERAKRSDTA